MSTFHFLNELVTVHLVGARNDVRTRMLHAAALGEYALAKIVQLLDPARDVARIAQLGYPARDMPRAYVGVGNKCLAPVSEAKRVAEEVRRNAK